MKLGCSSWSYHPAIRAGRLDLAGFLEISGNELEVDGVELVDLHFASTDPQYLRMIKKRCVDLHLTLAGLAVSNDFGQRERRETERQAVQRWCDVAAYMGAPIVRVYAGWLPQAAPPRDEGRIIGFVRRIVGPGRVDPRRAWSDIAETLRLCADYAGERGVTLAVQNARGENVVGSPWQLAQIVRDVGSPWLKVCLDPADFGDLTGLDAVLPSTVQAHARLRDVAEDGSEASGSWPLLLQAMQLGRYRGFIMLNYDGTEDPTSAVPRSARFMRDLLRLLGRQRALKTRAPSGNAGTEEAHRFVHPDLTETSVAEAIAHVRSDVPAR